MSEGDSNTVIVSSGDVTVHKSYSESEFPVPVLSLYIQNWAPEEAQIRLVERVPEDADLEKVGLHPETREHWERQGELLVFQRTFDGDEEFMTAYSYEDGFEELDAWLTEPEIQFESPGSTETQTADEADPDTASPETDGTSVEDTDEEDAFPTSEQARDESVNSEGFEVDRTNELLEEDGQSDEVESDTDADEPGADHEQTAAETADQADGSPDDPDADHTGEEEGGDGTDIDDGDAPDETLAPTESGPSSDSDESVDEREAESIETEDKPAEVLTDDGEETDTVGDGETPIQGSTVESEDRHSPTDKPTGTPSETEADETPVETTSVNDDETDTMDESDTMDDESTDDSSTQSGGTGSADSDLRVGEDESVLRPEVVEGEENVGQRLLENIEGLRNTLESASKEGGAVEARIRQLQSDVGNLKAYTNAFEEFLEENGTGRQIIESVQEELDDVEDDLDDLRGVARNHADTLSELQESVGGLEDRLDDHERELDDLTEITDENAEEIDELDDDIEAVEDGLAEHGREAAEQFDEVDDELESLDEAVADNADAIDDVATELDQLGDDLDDLSDETAEELSVHENRLDDLDTVTEDHTDRFDDVDERLDDTADSIENLEGILTALESDVDEHVDDADERFEAATDERDALSDRLDETNNAIDANANDIDDLAARTDENADAIDELESEVASKFETLEEDIEMLKEWQENLSSVMGRPGASPEGEGD